MGAELNKALAAFQLAIPRIDKSATADTGSYTYDYAPLDAVVAKVMPLLGKHGLSLITRPTVTADGRFVLSYSLLHASGEREDGDYPLPERGKPQELGSALTYARRYILCAVTGVAPGGEDDDGAAASQIKAPRQQRPARLPSRPTAAPVRTATTGPEHERLRHGTVEPTPDDARADRGPVPPDRDHWAGQPPGELPKRVNGTVGVIQQHFKRLRIDDRDVRLGYTAQLAGLDGLASTNDLSDEQAKHVLDRLAKCRDDTALRALLDHGDAPAEVTT
jgi:hypothetical protein